MLDRTQNRSGTDARIRAIADKYIAPAGDGRELTTTDNQPPAGKELTCAKDAMAELSTYLKDNPVIQNAAEAKIAGGWIERTRIALQEARAERDAKTRPHNDALKTIRELYEIVREKSGANRGGALQAAYDECKRRVLAFMDAEKKRREAEAEIARQAAAEAERIAREAEAVEQEALANAQQGECTDVGGAIEQADAAFADFQKASRAAAIAERDTKVRVTSTMGGRSLAPKEVRVLVIGDLTNAIKALTAMGMDAETEALLAKRAERFEEAFGELPPGVNETFKLII